MVDRVIFWDDKDNSACGAIDIVLSELKTRSIISIHISFDLKKWNLNLKFKNNERVSFEFGVGPVYKKTNSSSLIMENFKNKFL